MCNAVKARIDRNSEKNEDRVQGCGRERGNKNMFSNNNWLRKKGRDL